MKRETYFHPCDRYLFDFDICSHSKGFAQIDTSEDAPYYGIWTNPTQRKVVSYLEGDVIIETAENDDEYIGLIRKHADFHFNNMQSFKIDTMCDESIKSRFSELQLNDLIH